MATVVLSVQVNDSESEVRMQEDDIEMELRDI
jgi:hypothetical protein